MYFTTADIDKCKGTNNCTGKQICVNKPGNYDCLSAVNVSIRPQPRTNHLILGEYLYYIFIYCTLGFLLKYKGFSHTYGISSWEGWKLERVPYARIHIHNYIFLRLLFGYVDSNIKYMKNVDYELSLCGFISIFVLLFEMQNY